MIEQAMIFALGFLVAGLVALAIAPAFWQRANRLTRRRLEAQVPLSVQEILAERDQLRAEFAVEQRRLELRTAQINLAHTADRAELGRCAAEIDALKAQLTERNEQNQDYEQTLERLQRDIAGVSAELAAVGKALYDAEGLYQTKQDELVKLTQAHAWMTELAEERLANHAAADARASALDLRLNDVAHSLREAEKRFTERTAQAAKLSNALAVAGRNFELLENNYGALQKKFEAESSRAAQIARELDVARREREAEQEKVRSLTIRVGVQEAAIEDADRREKKSRARHDQQQEKARELERAHEEKHNWLQTEYAALQGALEAARRRCETLEAELAKHRSGRSKSAAVTPEQQETASLRQDLSEIGAAIVRLAKAAGEVPPNLASPENNAAESQQSGGLEMTNQVGS